MTKNLLVVLSVLSNLSFALPSSTTLYNSPRYQPDGFCDRFTVMQVTGTRAKLTNGLAGLCEIVVRPNPRTYVINEGQDDGCGSMVYVGRSNDGRIIEITDNSRRLCENIVAATIVVTESQDGQTDTLYSSPFSRP